MGGFGDRIEEYEVLEHLGKGGFANVYRAKCLRSGIFVAIKMIDKSLMASAGMVGRVRQEVAIHSRLKHPAILELFTFFEDAHYVYLVLELAHNGELAKHFKIGMNGLSERAAADIFKQVVHGVSYLHSHNILHRDLSLNNLLLTQENTVKIADFGLATQLNEPDEKHVTMCGTPNYISPEVASRNYHGLPADVWGLGCMLYTLLVGRPPFHTQHVKSTLNRVIRADYQIPDDLSSEAQNLLQRLLCRDPSKRITLSAILEHPFLVHNTREVSSKMKPDISKDSGFQTTWLSSNLNKLYVDGEKPISSTRLDISQQSHRQDNGVSVEKNPTSFNVLGGIPASKTSFLSDKGHSSFISNGCSMFQNQLDPYLNVRTSMHEYQPRTVTPMRNQNYNSDYESQKYTFPLPDKTKNVQKDCEPEKKATTRAQGNNEDKENILPNNNLKATSIGVPPLCASRLATLSHRTRNAILMIQQDSVVVKFIKKRGKDREERITEICEISKDGMKVIIYPVESGKGKLVAAELGTLSKHTPTADEIFTYHNLPQKHWKKYLYAARFVDLVRAKTPKITLYSPVCKCQLMESGTDFEAFFYSGEKITMTSSDGIKLFDKNDKSHSYTDLPSSLQPFKNHFEECLLRCRRVESALATLADDSFPLIIGKRPTAAASQTQSNSPNVNGTPVIDIVSFCQNTNSSSKISEINWPQDNIHRNTTNHSRRQQL